MTSNALQGAILSLGSGTFTHDIAGIPIIIVCTPAVGDPAILLARAPVSWVVWFWEGRRMKGADWRDHADAAYHLLRMCVSLHSLLILIARQTGKPLHATPQPATRNVLRQYALHILFIHSILDGARASAEPVHIRSQTEYAPPRPHCHTRGME